MQSIIAIILTLLIIGFVVSLKKETSFTMEPTPTSEQSYSCEHGSNVSGVFYPKGRHINVRSGPGENYDRVLNQKFYEVTGKKDYVTITRGMVLQGLCEEGNWIKIKVTEVDADKADWEAGWVSKDYVTDDMPEDQKLGLVWDIEGDRSVSEKDKPLLRKAALRILRDESNCRAIIYGDRSTTEKGKYYVACRAKSGEDFNIWFAPNEVEQEDSLVAPTPYPAEAAWQMCQDAIRANTVHPSTLNIHHFMGSAGNVFNNGNRMIVQGFSAKNAFNLEIEYEATCMVDPKGSLDITIVEMQ